MSDRRNMHLYTGSDSGGSGWDGMDLFGMKSKREIQKHQAFSDIDTAAASKLSDKDRENAIAVANNQHNLAVAKLVNMLAKDGNFDKLDEATKAGAIEMAKANQQLALTQGRTAQNNANSDEEYSLSPTGSNNRKTGNAAKDLADVYKNRKEGTIYNAPGGTSLSPRGDTMEPNTDITGQGSSLTTSRFAPHLNPQTMKYENILTEKQDMTPGSFRQPVGRIDLSSMPSLSLGGSQEQLNNNAMTAGTPPDERPSGLQTMPRNGLGDKISDNIPDPGELIMRLLKSLGPDGIKGFQPPPNYPMGMGGF